MTTTAAGATALARDLEAIVGAEHVTEGTNIDGVVPETVVTPADSGQVAAVLRYAHERRLAVVPAGGMSHQHIGAIPERVDIVLRTTRLTGVEHYDAGDLTIGVGAGTTVAQLKAIIAEHRQVLPLEIENPERTTVGGLIACNLHGPMKHGFGGVRDWLIGVRFVTADGRIAKAGGRVVKNVAGYDIGKLLVGSYGTVAVIVGASFRLFPAPRRTRTYVCEFGSLSDALDFRARVLQSPLSPLALELLSPHAQAQMAREGANADDTWQVLVRAAGSDAVLGRYRSELGGDVTRQLEAGEEESLWNAVAAFPATIFEKSQNAMLVRLDLPPSETRAALAAAERAAFDNNFVMAAIGRMGIGALLLAFCPIAVDPPAAMQYANTISAFRGSLSPYASAVVLRCPLEVKRHVSVWGTSPNDMEAMRAIKRAFDANDILNRGRFLF